MKKVIKVMLVKEITFPDRLYARVKTIAAMWDMNPATVWRHMNRMREMGIYDDIVIEESERTKYISVEGFRQYMKSRHLKYLQA